MEDRYVKKREREDLYLKDFSAEDRPVLMIKNKHMYKPANNHVIDDTNDNYYKISENTHEVDDIDVALRTNENFIRKHTIVHKPSTYMDPLDPSAIYKVEGIEFLPEGYLELDPLLYKDEYEFENRLNEKSFENEQRKLKVLRRKQYEQKNSQKMRDVTIYLVDEQKNKIIDYLDSWYNRNRRRMTENEIAAVAQELEVERDKLSQLQDLYLKRKEIINNQKLSDYLHVNGHVNADKLDIPPSLKKYFVKNVDPDLKLVKARLGRSSSPFDEKYYQQYGIKKLKNPFCDRINESPIEANFSQTAPVQAKTERSLSKTRSDATLKKDSKPIVNMNVSGSSVKKNRGVDRQKSSGAFNKSPKSSTRTKDNDDASLNLYFDNEINQLLDKIKGDKLSTTEPNQTHANELIGTGKQISFGEKNKVEVKGGAINTRGSSTGKNNTRPATKTEKINQIIGDYAHFEDIERRRVSSEPQDGDEYPKVKHNPEMDTFGREKSQVQDNIANERGRSNPPPSTDILEPQRITIVEKSTRGISVISQKLKPTLVGDEYYYQTIEEIVDNMGKRNVTIITRNDKGSVVSKVSIDPALIGKYYENKILEVEEELRKDINQRKVTIVIVNERGTVVSMQTLKPSMLTSLSDTDNNDIEEVFDLFGRRKSTITTKREKGSTIRTHKLRPTLIGNQYYQQVVDEITKDNGTKKITVVTKNERGDTVSVKEIHPMYIAEGYYTIVINDMINEMGQRQVTVITNNDRNETLVEQTFRPTGATAIGRKYIDDLEGEILEEIVDSYGNRKLTVISKDVKGESVVYQEIRPVEPARFNHDTKSRKATQIGDQYYGETIERIMESIRQRKTTIRSNRASKRQESKFTNQSNKNSLTAKDRSPVQSKARSLRQTAIGSEHYKALIDGVIIDDTDLNSQYYSIRASQVGSHYYLEVVEEALNEANNEDEVDPSTGERYFNELVDETLLARLQAKSTIQSKALTNYSRVVDKSSNTYDAQPSLRPTIIGEDYYGQIVSSMLQHENNRKLSQLTADKVAIRPTQILNEYYSALYAETAVHRQRLVAAKHYVEEHYKKVVDDNIKETDTKKSTTKSMKNYTLEEKQRNAQEIKNKLNEPKVGKGSLKPIINKEDVRDKSKTYANNLKESKAGDKKNNKSISKIDEKSNTSNVKRESTDKQKTKTSLLERLDQDRIVDGRKTVPVNKAENVDKTHKKNTLLVNDFELENSQEQLLLSTYKEDNNEFNNKKDNVLVNANVNPKKQSAFYNSDKDAMVVRNKNHTAHPELRDDHYAKKSKVEDIKIEEHDANNKDDHGARRVRNRDSRSHSETKRASTDKNKRERSYDAEEETRLERKIAEVFAQERDKLSDDIVRKLEKVQFGARSPGRDNMLDEFYKFCKEILPHDSKYKESILYVSLFYYFLEKNGLKAKGD